MRKTILLMLTLATTTLAIAQNKQEASIYIGAGSSSLGASLNSGEISAKFGPSIGLGYTYKFATEWGFVSGLEMAFYKSEVSSNELKDKYMTQDNYGNNFEWRLALHNLKENLEGTYLNIPIMVQYTPQSVDKLYTNLGLKVGIPLSGKYDAKYTKLVASGYYPETNTEYTDINFRGFGEFDGKASSGDIDFGIAFILSAECGLKWPLSNSMNLYAGGYIDYGLNNIVKGSDYEQIIPYNKDYPTNFEYNSLTASKYTEGNETKPFIDKIYPLAFGIKVRLGFSL